MPVVARRTTAATVDLTPRQLTLGFDHVVPHLDRQGVDSTGDQPKSVTVLVHFDAHTSAEHQVGEVPSEQRGCARNLLPSGESIHHLTNPTAVEREQSRIQL